MFYVFFERVFTVINHYTYERGLNEMYRTRI